MKLTSERVADLAIEFLLEHGRPITTLEAAQRLKVSRHTIRRIVDHALEIEWSRSVKDFIIERFLG